MAFALLFTDEAQEQLAHLDETDRKKARKVRTALGRLAANPRHPGLQTHEYITLTRAMGEKVFEAYVENQTPGAYRVFWHYGAGRNHITILSIPPHP